MMRQLIKRRRRYVLLDIGTQEDLLTANGKHCVEFHRSVLFNIRRIMAWARAKKVPVVSTCEVYECNNGSNYCLDGTAGQRKIRYTLLFDRITYPADGETNLPNDLLHKWRQIILHTRCKDPFEEPKIERLLSEILADEFIIVGTELEGAVMSVALGLLQRQKHVTVLVDAVGFHNEKRAEFVVRKLSAKGAKLIKTARFAGQSHLRQIGSCKCHDCRATRNGRRARSKMAATLSGRFSSPAARRSGSDAAASCLRGQESVTVAFPSSSGEPSVRHEH